MTRDEIRRIALEELSNIAPETDLSSLSGAAPLRETLDIDSMDFMNFIVALHARLKVDIPEADYGRIASLDDLVAYIELRRPT